MTYEATSPASASSRRFQLSVDGEHFAALDFRFKAGDPARPPPFVAPHQPRVDFLLWFYGLSYEAGPPEYVARLLERVCHEPAVVAPLFAGALPEQAQAVKLVFWEYHVAPAEAAAWWTRSELGSLGPVECAGLRF